jgi:hypothetical protein
MDLFQQFLNKVGRGYGQLDKNVFGGLLPGGAASLASPVKQQIQKTFSPANIRDVALIPVLDKGLSTGAIPPVAGMYARFLTGTAKPLTELPPALQPEIPAAYASATATKQILNPEWDTALQKKINEKLTLVKDPFIARMFAINDLESANIPRYISSQQVIDRKGNIPIGYNDYPDNSILAESLGRFWVNPKTKEVKDRYDFNYYTPELTDPGLRNPLVGLQMLTEGNPRGAIAISDALGFIKPGYGYEIKAPLR